ncbi:hypothetical protein N1851_020632 [Merluccius polli]|uniref:Uncharacterized protein n=1 Tax=Merluccius polli TaxID=89951 RepID=A0AA47MJX3_MERPO|nr:hypothetical protein N1851_020632 [Merluccius polli]
MTPILRTSDTKAILERQGIHLKLRTDLMFSSTDGAQAVLPACSSSGPSREEEEEEEWRHTKHFHTASTHIIIIIIIIICPAIQHAHANTLHHTYGDQDAGRTPSPRLPDSAITEQLWETSSRDLTSDVPFPIGCAPTYQKGGISVMPGCLEHTGVVTQLIREEAGKNKGKGNLTVLWLDLKKCIWLHFTQASSSEWRVSSGAITSSWRKVEIGLITGCTISVTLFSLAVNMLTKSAEPECRGPRTNSA